MELLIYTRKINPRVEYIFRFIFKDILRVHYRLTSSITEAQGYCGAVISYSHQKINNSVQVTPNGLLCEEGVKHHAYEVHDWNGLPMFLVTAPGAEIPFDIFSASFYLVTRYEEYSPFHENVDKHGRFCYQQSIAAKNNFLHLPVVDLWAFKLLSILKSKNYDLTLKARRFNSIVTVDLDSAYAVKGKGLMRVALSTLRLLITGEKVNVVERFKILMGLSPDPYDIYSSLIPLLPESPRTICFIHAGRWGKFDKAISIRSDLMRSLVNRLGERFRIGIHPSYRSYLNESEIRTEISALVDALNQSVACSRQHYLRLSLPLSYRVLAKLGITEDYTMGYSETVGFRAGTCTPFAFYDLIDEQVLSIKVYPFYVMDTTLVGGNISPEQSSKVIRELIDTVKQVEGTFISIWHIDYLSGFQQERCWLDTLKQMLGYLKGFQNAN